MGIHFERAVMLLQQSRADLAESELRLELTAEPENARAHALLGACLLQSENFDGAESEVREAIRLAPDDAQNFASLARVLLVRRRTDEAEKAVREAIALDPYDPDFFEVASILAFDRSDWEGSLRLAEEGLALDPEHVECINRRAAALMKLGRREEAGRTMESALQKAPEDPWTHANMGWTLLERADPSKAMEHFREALRLDADMEWARMGIVEALKARYFIYGLMLRWFFFMARLSPKIQWAVVIGGLVGYQLLDNAAARNPTLAPYATPVLIAYMVFAVMTWLAVPLFDLMLFLNRFGRLSLSDEQKTRARWVAVFLAAALLSLILWAATGSFLYKISALVFGLMALPISAIWNCRPGWPRKAMALYAAAMAVPGAGALLLIVGAAYDLLPPAIDARTFGDWFAGLLRVFFWAAFGSTWAANILMNVRPKR